MSVAAVKAGADVWWRVHDMLRSREMPPPEDRESPTDAEYRAVLSWLEGVLPGGAGDPGRVTVRRLNRVEYRNTIRDLLGVDFDSTTNFPADDVATPPTRRWIPSPSRSPRASSWCFSAGPGRARPPRSR